MKARNRCFLVVDDSVADQVLIVRALKEVFPHEIHCVSSANEAIRYLNGEGEFTDRAKYAYPTLIMTDLKMPEGTGFDLLHNLKSNPLWVIIPTVVLSASSDPDDIKKCYELGASCYLTKPSGYPELKVLMRKLVEFWDVCDVPEIDVSGKILATESKGKLGEGFPSPVEGARKRH